MIPPELLQMLSSMKVPMVVFLGDEEEEDSELLREMKRHHDVQEKLPHIVPSPG